MVVQGVLVSRDKHSGQKCLQMAGMEVQEAVSYSKSIPTYPTSLEYSPISVQRMDNVSHTIIVEIVELTLEMQLVKARTVVAGKDKISW